jgi:hypothetical protein
MQDFSHEHQHSVVLPSSALIFPLYQHTLWIRGLSRKKSNPCPGFLRNPVLKANLEPLLGQLYNIIACKISEQGWESNVLPAESSLGKLPVVPTGDTETIPCCMLQHAEDFVCTAFDT